MLTKPWFDFISSHSLRFCTFEVRCSATLSKSNLNSFKPNGFVTKSNAPAFMALDRRLDGAIAGHHNDLDVWLQTFDLP
jgi:hypothetical protein